jgi:hypothetical protein
MKNGAFGLKLLALVSVFGIVGLVPAQAMAGWFSCQPTEVIEFGNRIHVRCSNTVTLDGDVVRYVAIGKSDNATSARFVSLGNAALLSGKVFRVYLATTSASNTTGCLASDCRTPAAFGVMN